nr:PREDICTED: homeobox protein Hox-C11 isoform X2 [Lepisosteus oculatus]
MFNSVNLGNFCSQTRKDRTSDFGDRAGCASNLYLPSCTYYVPEFSAVSSFLPQAPSRQINYPYSTNLSQVQPVREVSYSLDPPSKWHHRSNYTSCYSGDDLVHRECLPPSTVTEMLMKNESVYSHHHHHHHHPSSNHPSTGFYSGVGKNNVLPQGFDRFFESAYCGAEPPPENCVQKSEAGKLEAEHEPGALPSAADAEKDPEDEEENTNSGSCASSSATKDGSPSKGNHSSRYPSHAEEEVPILQVSDPGAGARVFL